MENLYDNIPQVSPHASPQNILRAPSEPPSSAAPAPTCNRVPIHPWRRFFARFLDYVCGGFVGGFGIGLLDGAEVLSHKVAVSLTNPIIFGFIICLAWMLVETFLLETIGNTPGRALFGLRLVSRTEPPRYLARSFGVWLYGMWMGLPLFNCIGNLISYGRLRTKGLTRWDDAFGFRVEARPLSAERWAVLTLLILGISIVSVIAPKLWPEVYKYEQPGFSVKNSAPASPSVSRSVHPAETPAGTAGSPAVTKPRFDFYTILPEMEVKVPEWEVAKDARKPPEKPSRAAAYMLQVGSFQRYEDADRIKARLALIGVSADVQPVVINGKDTWHRVRVGPFQDLNKLQATRSWLAENHISFMLVRTKADEEPTSAGTASLEFHTKAREECSKVFAERAKIELGGTQFDQVSDGSSQATFTYRGDATTPFKKVVCKFQKGKGVIGLSVDEKTLVSSR